MSPLKFNVAYLEEARQNKRQVDRAARQLERESRKLEQEQSKAKAEVKKLAKRG